MNSASTLRTAGALLLAGVAGLTAASHRDGWGKTRQPDSVAAAHGAPASPRLTTLPIRFEENLGQTDHQVRYLSRGGNYSLFLTPKEAVLSLRRLVPPAQRDGDAAAAAPEEAVVRLQTVGGNEKPELSASHPMPCRTSYFIGKDPSKWRTNVPNFERVTYRGVYPGVDLVYYGNQRSLEYDFQVAPGSNPGRIRCRMQGARRLRLEQDGSLTVETAAGNLREPKPVVYQEVKGRRQLVDGRFVLRGQDEFGFELGTYDRTQRLVIDPQITSLTFLGGTGSDEGNAIASGYTNGVSYYVVGGKTTSANFPTTSLSSTSVPGYRTTPYPGGDDAYLAVYNANLTLEFCSYIGGSGSDTIKSVSALNGVAWFTGTTTGDVPVTTGALQTQHSSGANDAFFGGISFLTANPQLQLVYCSYLGGNGSNTGNGIALDGSGNVFLTGTTTSSNLPVLNATNPTFGGGTDAYIMGVANGGGSRLFCTYVGAAGDDRGNGIATDFNGHVYVTGALGISGVVTSQQAFVTELNTVTNPGTLVHSKVVGGSGADEGTAVNVGPTGAVYVAGTTNSTDFPTVSPIKNYDPTSGLLTWDGAQYHGGVDGFVMALDSYWTTSYATYFGGSGDDTPTCIGPRYSPQPDGHLMVGGYTNSSDLPRGYDTGGHTPVGFPTGDTDGFLAWIDSSNATCQARPTSLLGAGYFGGNETDVINGLLITNTGAMVVGSTSSGTPTNHGQDAFVANMTVQGPSAPDKPVGLTATPVSAHQINLSWSPITNGGGVDIYRSDTCNSEPMRVGSATGTTYSDINLVTKLSYTYYLVAINCFGGSYASDSVTAQTLDDTPIAPDNFTTPSHGATYVDLSWTDMSNNETEFVVERSLASGGGTMQFHVPSGNGFPCWLTRTYRDTGLTPGTAYSYRVWAHGTYAANPDSTPAGPIVVTTTSAPLTPSNLTAKTTGLTQIQLNWQDNSTNETAFLIERKTGAASFAQVGSVNSGVTTYTDVNLTPNTTYTYQVKAAGSGVNSDPSNPASATTSIPATPTGLTALGGSTDEIDLSWSFTGQAVATRISIERSGDNGATWSEIASVSATATTYVDAQPPAGQYLYRVRAFNGDLASAYSNTASASTSLSAPTGLTAQVDASTPGSRINLAWQPANRSVFNQAVQRASSSSGPWSTVATVSGSTSTYPDQGLPDGTTYYYKIVAVNGAQTSPDSNVASATTTLNPPSNLVATLDSADLGGTVHLTWQSNGSGTRQYNVERAPSGFSFQPIASGVTGTSYTDSSVNPRASYQYRVQAVVNGVTSGYSNVASITTLSPTPTLVGGALSPTSVNLSLSNYGYTGTVSLEGSTDGGTTYTVLGTFATSGSYTDNTLTANATKKYRARVLFNAQYSSYSNVVTLTTPPAAPTAVTATALSTTSIQVSWSYGSDTALDRFEIHEDTQTEFAAPTARSFIVSGLTPNESYIFGVSAHSAAGGSSDQGFSNIAHTFTYDNPVLTVTVTSGSAVKLAWNDGVTSSYAVQQSTDGSTWTTVKTVSASPTNVSGLTAHTLYYFRVQGLSSGTPVTGWSNVAQALTDDPVAPSGLVAVPGSSPGTVQLTWNDQSQGEQGFKIMRSNDGGATFNLVTTVDPGSTSFVDTGRTSGRTLQYRVKSYNGISTSDPSNTATVVVP